jgi:hypothetical protein
MRIRLLHPQHLEGIRLVIIQNPGPEKIREVRREDLPVLESRTWGEIVLSQRVKEFLDLFFLKPFHYARHSVFFRTLKLASPLSLT